MNSYKILVASITLYLVCSTAYTQSQKLSPKFSNVNGRSDAHAVMMFSVSCKDTTLFAKTYRNRLQIINRYSPAGVYTVRSTHAMIREVMVPDANITFIDIPATAVPEAGTDFVGQTFNRITKARSVFPDVDGSSVTVSIKEQHFDSYSIDLLNRWFTTAVTAKGVSQHATTMATIIGGAGNSSVKAKGVAPATRLTSSDFTNLLPDADAIFQEHAIHIQNHSYGVPIENYYGNEAAAYDKQVYDNPALLHVFSAGNSGASTPLTGTYKGLPWANLSGNFKHGKNPILVTAVDTTLRVNPLNSRGPAYDGRLKPELTTFGQNGTSDAAALLSGVAALLHEQYKTTYNAVPAAALLKAVLIASADDIGSTGIDYTYGYGSVNAHEALRLLTNGHHTMRTLGSNDVATVSITVPAHVSSLRVAVAWTDVAAAPNSTTALVHDIDATLRHGGDAWLPWMLRTAADTDSLTAAPRRRRDTLNTVEYITVETPVAGVYTLTLRSAELTASTQDVAVAWQLEDDTPFAWDYPTAADILETGTQDNLFWTHHGAGTGSLSLQLNDGAWLPIRTAVALDRPFHWTPPDTLAAARLKMEVNGEAYVSDVFTLSPPQKITVAYACTDEFALTWTPVPGAEEYMLYTLGDTYLQKLFSTYDTTITLPTTLGPYFAVAARFDTHTAQKSATIDYTNQGAHCYINLFDALRYDAEHVRIQLNLSTWLNIKEVRVFKTTAGARTVYTTFSPGRDTQFEWEDTALIPDTMRYQAEVVLTNGAVITSDEAAVLVEPKGEARLFPNPVAEDGIMNVLSAGLGLSVELLDNQGRKVFAQALYNSLDVVDLKKLHKGMYFVLLRSATGAVTWRGRIIKL